MTKGLTNWSKNSSKVWSLNRGTRLTEAGCWLHCQEDGCILQDDLLSPSKEQKTCIHWILLNLDKRPRVVGVVILVLQPLLSCISFSSTKLQIKLKAAHSGCHGVRCCCGAQSISDSPRLCHGPLSNEATALQDIGLVVRLWPSCAADRQTRHDGHIFVSRAATV